MRSRDSNDEEGQLSDFILFRGLPSVLLLDAAAAAPEHDIGRARVDRKRAPPTATKATPRDLPPVNLYPEAGSLNGRL